MTGWRIVYFIGDVSKIDTKFVVKPGQSREPLIEGCFGFQGEEKHVWNARKSNTRGFHCEDGWGKK